VKRFAVVALTLALGVPAAVASSTGPRPQTVATIPSAVWSFAQNDRYVAWIAPRKSDCYRLFMQDVSTGKRTAIPHRCELGEGDPGAMVLAGDRAFWASEGASNLTEYTNLMTASLRTRRVTSVDYQSIYKLGFDHIVPPVTDGRAVYYWSSPEDATPGPIYRYDGRVKSRRLTRTIGNLAALGAGEGRWAFARAVRALDCAQEPTWYPAGRIAYASGGGRSCRGGIWVVNANGRGARRLTMSGRNPDWSPGSELAFDDRGSVKVLSGTSAPRVLITRGTNPSWHPDGTKIAFVRDGSILVADADGSAERVVVSGAIDPDWSPDGTKLVFARVQTANPGLGVVGVDGGGLRSLTTGSDRSPSWSPDGRRIAYAHCTNAHAGCPRDVSQILEIAPDGTGQRARTEDGDETDDTAPAWGPDAQLAFARSRDWQDAGDSHVFTLSRRLTTTPAPRTPVEVRTPAGKTLARGTPRGAAIELAVTRRFTAALVDDDGWRLEFVTPRRRAISFPGARRVSSLSASGRRAVVLVDGRKIFVVGAISSRLRLVARVARPPIGLSIVGRRIAWAENVGRRARVRAVTLPR
jgi:Tol biopolymer transport system component